MEGVGAVRTRVRSGRELRTSATGEDPVQMGNGSASSAADRTRRWVVDRSARSASGRRCSAADRSGVVAARPITQKAEAYRGRLRPSSSPEVRALGPLELSNPMVHQGQLVVECRVCRSYHSEARSAGNLRGGRSERCCARRVVMPQYSSAAVRASGGGTGQNRPIPARDLGRE